MFSRRLLLAKADAKISTFDGLTPLHLAARSRQSNIVGLLLDVLRDTAKEAVNATDKIGWSPIW
jgi:ankyrin repeat protein